MLEETNQEKVTLSEDTVETTNTEKNVVENVTPKTYKEEEFNKALQSQKSKGKFEILQELGIKSVDEFKNLKNTYETSINEKEELSNKLEALQREKDTLMEENTVIKLNIAEEFKSDALTLAKTKVSSEVTLEMALNNILEKNPNWRKSGESLKIGTEKSENKTSEISEDLKTRFPWLK